MSFKRFGPCNTVGSALTSIDHIFTVPATTPGLVDVFGSQSFGPSPDLSSGLWTWTIEVGGVGPIQQGFKFGVQPDGLGLPMSGEWPCRHTIDSTLFFSFWDGVDPDLGPCTREHFMDTGCANCGAVFHVEFTIFNYYIESITDFPEFTLKLHGVKS